MKYGKDEKVREHDSDVQLVYRKNRTIPFSQARRWMRYQKHKLSSLNGIWEN